MVPSENGSVKPISEPRIGGKARMIAEYAATTGAVPLFNEYQCGWIGFGPANETKRNSSRKDSGMPEHLLVQCDLPVAEVRAILAWIRGHQRLISIMKRARWLATGWNRYR